MRGSAAARLLRLWVRIPPGAWMSVSCECCMLSGSLCVGLITRPGDCGASFCVKPRECGCHGPLGGCCAPPKRTQVLNICYFEIVLKGQ
jgi:hypothetical protein